MLNCRLARSPSALIAGVADRPFGTEARLGVYPLRVVAFATSGTGKATWPGVTAIKDPRSRIFLICDRHCSDRPCFVVPHTHAPGTDQVLGGSAECFLLRLGRCVCCANAAAVGVLAPAIDGSDLNACREMMVNAVAFAFTSLLVVAGVWLANDDVACLTRESWSRQP
jgi:hypothetical protein